MKSFDVHETRKPAERAFLIGVDLNRDGKGEELDLDELAALAESAGAEVVGAMDQKLDRPHTATYMGPGKLEEAAEEARRLDADLVISDNDLSPAQARNVEKVTGLRLVDRSQLIMDIFAERAQTHQAKLQVELAQLQYTLPRLRRLWTHLDRYKGGIGMRGPGERQIETDRRIIQKKISDLKERLQTIDARKTREVDGRKREWKVSLVGYTNAGKSTLLNALTDADVGVADMVFSTLDTRTRTWQLGAGMKVLLSDTVGFIRKLPHGLVASFRATLAEACHADLLLHVVDGSHPKAPEHIRAVRGVLKEIGAIDIPTILVANKADQVENMMDVWSLEKDVERHIVVSARSCEGLDELRERVRETLMDSFRSVRLRFHGKDGALISRLRSQGSQVDDPRDEGEWLELDARVPPWTFRYLGTLEDSSLEMTILD